MSNTTEMLRQIEFDEHAVLEGAEALLANDTQDKAGLLVLVLAAARRLAVHARMSYKTDAVADDVAAVRNELEKRGGWCVPALDRLAAIAGRAAEAEKHLDLVMGAIHAPLGIEKDAPPAVVAEALMAFLAPRTTPVIQLRSAKEWQEATGCPTAPAAKSAMAELRRGAEKAAERADRLEAYEATIRKELPVKCGHCKREPATCIGSYEGHEPQDTPACDTCCGHGNEDGHCEPILALFIRRLKAENALLLRQPASGALLSVRRWLELQFADWLAHYPSSGDQAIVLQVETLTGKAALRAGEVRAFLEADPRAKASQPVPAPSPSGPFCGEQMGVKLIPSEEKWRPHISFAVEVKESGRWRPMFQASSHWIDELIAQLVRAQAFCQSQDPDMDDDGQYGWRFKAG